MRGGPLSLADAPQWLVSAFVRSAVAVGATAGREEIQRTARTLVARWQAPERRFHNLRHLTDVLARVEELAGETHVPDVVRLAAWYHGAVFNASAPVAYARRGGEDEVASAALARGELEGLGVPAEVTDRVGELIGSLTRHDADGHDIDALALCDADLAILAVEPQRYAAYRRAVREEYAHIPERDYLASRIAILTRLLQRRRLFVSPFSLSWEEPARENLTAELSHLRTRLAALGGTETPTVREPARAPGGRASSWPRRGPTTSLRVGGGSDDAGPGDAPPPSGSHPDDTVGPAGAGSASGTDDGGTPVSAATPPAASAPEDAQPGRRPGAAVNESDVPLSGIERDPELERRRRARSRRRRDRSAAQLGEEAEQSPGSLFRPPPRLPRA